METVIKFLAISSSALLITAAILARIEELRGRTP